MSEEQLQVQWILGLQWARVIWVSGIVQGRAEVGEMGVEWWEGGGGILVISCEAMFQTRW